MLRAGGEHISLPLSIVRQRIAQELGFELLQLLPREFRKLATHDHRVDLRNTFAETAVQQDLGGSEFVALRTVPANRDQSFKSQLAVFSRLFAEVSNGPSRSAARISRLAWPKTTYAARICHLSLS
jgi:hypothetical protein